MQQLLLDLLPANPPTFDNFVVGDNARALAEFRHWLASNGLSCHLCGEPASGKSHWLAASGFALHDAALDPALSKLESPLQLAVDHVDQLDAKGQIALFNQFNRLKAAGGKLLTAAVQPPAHLDVREDLRTRLGSGLICRLHPLSDAEKAAALAAQAEARALKLTPEAIDYLLRRAPRDMRSLSAFIATLDHYSLEHHRAITLPLLREVLQEAL
ncbi:MAG: DnaA regulatory inactivator Hda [Betaproteobacteria bacterium ADurb.Bin341]|nr:MAG: DnaA regulatory inactivator Hda [Betaproteobacteria bacterium ADurb.Bin341]